MSVANYSELQDTGVKWLGEVPTHWLVGRFRNHFRESPEKIDKEVVGVMLSVSGYRGVEVKEYDDENRRRLDEELVNYRIVRVGQLVVNSMWLNAAGLGVSAFEGHVSPAYRSYWIGEGLDLRYVHHLMRSEVYVDAYMSMEQGIRPNSLQLSRSDLMNLPVLIPPLDEQKAISSFLDVETSKIDGLVSEQRRLIELLKEKRQAVISHAVTKGLNPNAPMKPSGIQWLGDVPEHWSVVTVRRVLVAIEQGWSPQCDSRPANENEWGILKTGCVNRGVFCEIENKALPADLEPVVEYEVKAGDVLMSRASGSPELVGATAFVYEIRPHLMLSDKTFRIHLAETMEPKFFVAVFNSQLMRSQIEQSISGAEGLANNLPQSKLRCFVLALPPVTEQREIVKELHLRCEKFDLLIAEAEQAVVLLQERRTALISAAVTGKIDVREFVSSSSAIGREESTTPSANIAAGGI